jgi:metal-sulfur cluster biosynthetic enzyme
MTDTDLLNSLRDCYDPLHHRNIVELGLVQSATLQVDPDAPGASIRGAAPRYIASVVLRAPGVDETRNAQLRAQIENRLLGIPAISRAHVDLLPTLFPVL